MKKTIHEEWVEFQAGLSIEEMKDLRKIFYCGFILGAETAQFAYQFGDQDTLINRLTEAEAVLTGEAK